MIKIELRVFSGRRDPTWYVPDDKLSDLGELLARLPRLEDATPSVNGLGYAGFLLSNPYRPEVTVRHERVTVNTGNVHIHLLDAHMVLEDRLLELARDHVEDEVLESVRKDRQ